MNNVPPLRYRPSRAWWLLLPLSFVLALGLVAVGVASYFFLSRDARCLRDSLAQALEAQAAPLKKKVEINVGTFTFSAARGILSFVPLKPEVRTVLETVRTAEVGVYRIPRGSRNLDRPALLASADEAMAARGWERLAGVTRDRTLVAIYVPTGSASGIDVEACLAVVNAQDVVVVSTRSRLAPLLDLALNRPEVQGHGQSRRKKDSLTPSVSRSERERVAVRPGEGFGQSPRPEWKATEL